MTHGFVSQHVAPREVEVAVRLYAGRGATAAARVMGWPLARVVALAGPRVRARRPCALMGKALELVTTHDVATASAATGYWPEEIVAALEARATVAAPIERDYERWTEAEDGAIRERYESQGVAALALLLGRSPLSVKHRAARLRQGATVSRRLAVYGAGRKVWTDAENEILAANWGGMALADLAALLPGRTIKAIRRRAENLALSD